MIMIVKNLYLVTGIKYYDAYQGDSGEEHVKLLVPAVDEDTAKKAAYETMNIDEITNVRLLYKITKCDGYEEIEGLDNETIYLI